MNPVQIIARKRDGGELSADEIAAFVDGFVDGSVPDYQMAAWAMAVYLRGMTAGETSVLTERMLGSGSVLPRLGDGAIRVDKHSTGGVGDKISLILAPLLACCDLQVPMISGRGLGATGGTLDKLESIPGFRTDLDDAAIARVLREAGCVITGATASLVPADRKLYALRDVTATVASIPLITASIMSKKLAETLDALVLDVKFGSGAFMKSPEDARRLADSLTAVGQNMGVPTVALLTDMNQPLGRMVGNAVEVNESLDVLRGGGPADVRALTIELAAELLVLANRVELIELARDVAVEQLDSGRALERFEHMVAAQGGRLGELPVAEAFEVQAARGGFVTAMHTEQLGLAVIELGGGRRVLTDRIDHSVGLEMLVRIGDRIDRDQPLVRVFSRSTSRVNVVDVIRAAIEVGSNAPADFALIAERLGS